MNERELYRHIIDGCDEALRDAFLRRMEMSVKVAETKLSGGGEIYDPVREDEIIARVSSGLPPELELKAQSLWRSLMRMSRSRQYNYFIANDSALKLAHEADIKTEMGGGTVLCPASDTELVSSALGMEAAPCGTIEDALDGLEKGLHNWAAVTLEQFYDSDRLFTMIYNRPLYLNSVTPAPGGKHIFLLSRNLYDLPENDMVTVAFTIRSDMHGSLAQTLEIFADFKINLDFLSFKTHNIDADTKQKRVVIFANFYANLTNPVMRSALLQLEKETPFSRVMGYRKALD